jgi:hypothetical protein
MEGFPSKGNAFSRIVDINSSNMVEGQLGAFIIQQAKKGIGPHRKTIKIG